jgi:hypothetical protein
MDKASVILGVVHHRPNPLDSTHGPAVYEVLCRWNWFWETPTISHVCFVSPCWSMEYCCGISSAYLFRLSWHVHTSCTTFEGRLRPLPTTHSRSVVLSNVVGCSEFHFFRKSYFIFLLHKYVVAYCFGLRHVSSWTVLTGITPSITVRSTDVLGFCWNS